MRLQGRPGAVNFRQLRLELCGYAALGGERRKRNQYLGSSFLIQFWTSGTSYQFANIRPNAKSKGAEVKVHHLSRAKHMSMVVYPALSDYWICD